MKLSWKMTLIFSIMMLAALFSMSMYASELTVNGANAFTKARFFSMSSSIQRSLEQDVSMMSITMQELTENTSFMAALNQMVRDDSTDQKVGTAARRAALQQLLQSPLVDKFVRVSFYTRDGLFLSNYIDKDQRVDTESASFKRYIQTLPWLDDADNTSGFVLLSPHPDCFSPANQERSIYGIVQAVRHHGRIIGYLQISDDTETLTDLMTFVDNKQVCVEAVFDNGQRLFSSMNQFVPWAEDVPENEFTTVALDTGDSRSVLHTHVDALSLHLYISQDASIIANADAWQRINMLRCALLILLVAMVLIMLVSMGLTRSIRKLTRKLRQIPDTSMVHPETIQLNQLLSNVTSPRDRETHELEQVFNHLMTRLHESTTNEMTLREGTLQAQLNALQAQINPHFIYNTLNIISAKSMESSNYDVIEICDQFAQMLRYSTDMSSRTATMAEEIENVHNYLMLAKARYENNLEFAIDVPENLGSITVPKLTLQPLVENALTHGYNGYNELRKLTITGRIEDEKLILCIRDNGTGFSEDRLQKLQEGIRRIENGTLSMEESGGHIGLLNTCLRLHFYSNGQMHISIHNDSGAVITMVMPCGMQENQEA